MVRISVIITCFNLERYIGEAIDSVRSQDIPEDFEIIVVDDCSTDGSRTIISGFTNIECVDQAQNQGVLLAMLAGIERASGDYIFFLDGDDRWRLDKLRKIVGLFDSDQDMIFATHDLQFIEADGSPIDRTSRVGEIMNRLPWSLQSQAMRECIVNLHDYVWLGSAMALRRSLADLDGFARFVRALPDARNTYQDWPLATWLATRSHSHKLGYCPERLFDYRLHHANHSGDARTAERARRNFRRARNTTAAMFDIAQQAPAQPHSLKPIRQALEINEGQLALYEGRSIDAITSYARGFPRLLRTETTVPETARLAIGLLIGASGLVRISEWRRKIMQFL